MAMANYAHLSFVLSVIIAIRLLFVNNFRLSPCLRKITYIQIMLH